MPHCTVSPVDDTSAACINSVLHNINYARALEGLGPLVLPSNYASQPVAVQQLIITDEERGDRGLSQFSGLDASLNTAAMAGAVGNTDPTPPAGYQDTTAGSIFALDYTPLGADYAWMYDDGYGGTNLDCTTPLSPACWGHRDNILGNWTTTGSQTAMMGDADTSAGQYTQIFANQKDPADSLVDPITPSSLPTPSSPTAPDVVQVLPASSPRTAAGTPVTIEGNYFGTSPQVYFGGVAATNVHVNWDGELTADAPADPAGAGTDQVVVTVTTGGGTSSCDRYAGRQRVHLRPDDRAHRHVRLALIRSADPVGQRDDPRHQLRRRIGGPHRRLRDGRQHRLHELQLEPDHHDDPALHQPGHRQHHRLHARRHERDLGGRPVLLHRQRLLGSAGHHQWQPGHLLGRRGRRLRRDDHGHARRQRGDRQRLQRLRSLRPAVEHQARLHGRDDRQHRGTPQAGDGGIFTSA